MYRWLKRLFSGPSTVRAPSVPVPIPVALPEELPAASVASPSGPDTRAA
jgi:hypothetical protein